MAKVLKADQLPAIYRTHEDPDPEKLRELRETLLLHGIQCGNLEKPAAMGALLKTLKDHPQGHSLRIHVLRSLKQARYSAHPEGHYGLAKNDYAHFTSPIRRYADLVVHRVMDLYMHRHKVESAHDNLGQRYSQGKLE
ncbi:RNB domain-containing ribonuclease, partial [Arthrospira platensis SPKY1]|nr:RNB domain-containing ribonuclease [Arthrospira platensis SPKY1]